MPDSDKDELAQWLALRRAPRLGPRTHRQLLATYSTPAALLENAARGRLPAALDAAARDYLRRPDWAAVKSDLSRLESAGCTALTLHHPRYPPLLRHLQDAPLVLFVRGDPAVLSSPQLAVVGSRNPTAQGRDTAFAFARALAAAGFGITSGLATGIDAAAHRGALDARGVTVAVLGTGPDRVYPTHHGALAQEVSDGGALVSEFLPGTPPRPHHFPQRNRLISGLALGTLVVEAAARSGSLITARSAVDQGREVFAVPGSIHNPLSRGCHSLIREGAKLVETVADIIEELGALAQFVLNLDGRPTDDLGEDRRPALNGPQERLLEALGFDPISMDVLIERSGLTPEEVSSMLLVLELQGYVAATGGGRYCRNQL
jgi:DNA processing protein